MDKEKSSLVRLITGDERRAIKALEENANVVSRLPLDIHEIVGDGTAAEIFQAINPNFRRLALTIEDIVDFCERHPVWLRQLGREKLFLTERNGNLFLVVVSAHIDSLEICIRPMSYEEEFLALYRHCVVTLTPAQL